MAAHGFERSIEVRAPLARVLGELAEPRAFLGLQPLLTEVVELPGAHGTRVFSAAERVPIAGPLALTNRLRVTLTPEPSRGRVGFATRAPLGVRLDGHFALTAAGAGTRVVECVEVRCARLLAPFVLPRAIAAQEALLANLKRRIEAVEE